ncbi:alpha/beta fold hydrolase [Naasia lichenicola]|uniref:Alpha/beta hydrolase n=1 Tax=Naasia lichenicola TaxID=2565933 RepID=A0A4S4FGV4_9MICO|nr:alpha/beta hydrolase [Naasia lichenicola]THG29351.1 alpha/beta hydrolase [Naasia lichenicola]
MTSSRSLTISSSFGDTPLGVEERGSGRPMLILHGGAGPASVTPFADLVADATGARVLVPTHPGFGGTARPEGLTTVARLAELYAGMIEQLELDDVTVIGNSLGGWVAAELALLHPTRLGRFALVDAVGIEVEGHPVASALEPTELAAQSWFDPSKAPSLDPTALPPAARAIFAGNRAALALYGGSMTDATLLGRLSEIRVPALVLWGEADRIADTDYGRAFAAAIPGARFELLERTGHVPQMETPDLLLEALTPFLGDTAR